MLFKISHKSTYVYSNLVFLEPHHLYFYPAFRDHLSLKSFNISLKPDSSGIGLRSDAEGNFYHQVWFNDQLQQLDIDVEIVIETFEINPFNFMIEDDKSSHSEALQLFLKKENLSSELISWLNNIRIQTGENILTFCTFLNQEIKAKWNHVSNYNTALMSPNQCFIHEGASCRDLSWMMINMLRQVNIPARFVSGYAFNPELAEGHELHAWVEVWFSGAGWVGVDPSSGVLATHNHIPVAVSYHPTNTLPVQGNFRGNATSKLKTEVVISQI